MNQNRKTVFGVHTRRLMSTLVVAAMVTVGLASCDFNNDKPVVDGISDRPMRLGTQIEKLVTDKGTRTPATDYSNLDSIGVYGYYTRDERWVWSTINEPHMLFANRFCNLKLKKSTSPSWSYTPLQYWPADTRMKISFFAYAPAVNPATDTVAIQSGKVQHFPSPLTGDVAEIPNITMTVDSLLSQQVDLLYSARIDRTYEDNGGVVDFMMKHALCGVRFSAQLASRQELNKGYTVRILELGLYDLHGKGNMRMDTGKWTFLDDYNSTEGLLGQYTLAFDKSKAKLINEDISGRNMVWENTKDAAHIAAGKYGEAMTGDTSVHYLIDTLVTNPSMGRFLMLLPQDFQSSSMFAAVLEFTYNNTYQMIVPFPVLLNQIPNNPKWEAGRVYEYRLYITDDFITIKTMAYMWGADVPVSGLVIL